MMIRIFYVLLFCSVSLWAMAGKVVSPNGKLSLTPKGDGWALSYKGCEVVEIPVIGLENMRLQSAPEFVRKVKVDYRMVSGKRLHCKNVANEYVGELGPSARVVLRLYNDGLTFRYEYQQDSPQPREATSYRIPEGMNRWMQQWADSYEGFFPLETTAKVKPVPSYGKLSVSPDGYNNRWGYPALLESADGIFSLITEANIEQGQSASCLYNEGDVFRVVPDATIQGKTCSHSPWRVIIAGSLSDVVESTLVTDVSDACKLQEVSWIHPGVVSWIYWAYNHGSNDYAIIKKYVDLAVSLKLPYVLIDAEWDDMDKLKTNNGKTIEDAISYAKLKGIKPMIWYNSSVGWIDGAPTPKFRLNKAEDREREFAWCEKLGVAGVKIDFFSGDSQKNMDYCIDLLECASRHHLLVNFHGATVPRGWQRTYPNLLSTEGVYGAEWYNNVPTFTAKAASHNATLPFTRNVIGPMDYTPCTFSDSQHPHITTNAHELALTVLFESGLQHLADRPESYLSQPREVQDFLSHLPAAWDETRLLSGYPGQWVVMARRSGNTWYVAGINGSDSVKSLSLPRFQKKRKVQAVCYADAGEKTWKLSTVTSLPDSVECLPRGGFVYVINQ